MSAAVRLAGPAPPAPRHETVTASFLASAGGPGGVTFVDLRERESRLSWSEVVERARRSAGALAARGIRPGERVAIVLRTGPAFLDAFFGALVAGAVPVPLYPPVRLGRMEEYLSGLARMIRVSGARLVVTGAALGRILGEALAEARPALGQLDAARLARFPRELARPASPGDLALVQFSSGSTAAPRPVALTQANLAAQVAALTALVSPTEADVLVSWLPLYHDMGLIGCLLGAACYPGPLVLIPPESFLARPALWLRALARHRGTVTAAPHFAFGYCADRVRDEELAGCDLRALRVALDGAEPVRPATLRRFAERFAPFGLDPRSLMPVYGLSEAALAVTFSPRRWPPAAARVDPARLAARGEVAPGGREVASVGVPVPGVEVEVRGEDGAPLPEDRLGRIHVRGPSVMQKYLGDPAATAAALRHGWLDTGDLGFVRGGELHVHGRAKDVVVVRGANHAPEEFEACLEGVPGLRPGCAVALGVVPEGGDAEGLLLLAERRRDARRSDAELEESARRAVVERTGVEPQEVRILAPGTLPRTSSGKMRRGEALRRFADGTLGPPSPAGPLALAARLARSALARARRRRRAG